LKCVNGNREVVDLLFKVHKVQSRNEIAVLWVLVKICGTWQKVHKVTN